MKKYIYMFLLLVFCLTGGGLFTQTATAQLPPVVEVRVYTDKAWFDFYGGDAVYAKSVVETQMNAAKTLYLNELNISLRIYYNTWDSTSPDPYTTSDGSFDNSLGKFALWVAANKPNGAYKTQDVSVVFSGYGSFFAGGLAGLSSACGSYGAAVVGRPPAPAYLPAGFGVAHEIAHTLSATHTTIDDGADTLYKIMDVENYSPSSMFTFAQFSRDQIHAFIPTAPCIQQ